MVPYSIYRMMNETIARFWLGWKWVEVWHYHSQDENEVECMGLIEPEEFYRKHNIIDTKRSKVSGESAWALQLASPDYFQKKHGSPPTPPSIVDDVHNVVLNQIHTAQDNNYINLREEVVTIINTLCNLPPMVVMYYNMPMHHDALCLALTLVATQKLNAGVELDPPIIVNL